MSRLLVHLPKFIIVCFFAATALFFVLNPAAFEKLGDLNILQYNLQGVNYTFIVSAFAYALTGILMFIYWLIYLKNSFKKLGIEAYILLAASVILIQLGCISTSPEFKERTAYVMVLTWVFAFLHGLAFLLIAAKTRGLSKSISFINLTLGLFIMYELPY